MEAELGKIGARLKQIRIDAGYTSYENFAVENDLPRMQYWRMEKGSNFTMNSLLKVLKAHDLSLEEFFKGL